MRSIFIFSVLMLTFRSFAQSPNTPIMGWKMEESNGRYTFTPATLFGPANFHYDIFPVEKNGVDDLTTWLSSKVEKDVQAAGYILVPNQSQARDVKSFKIYSVLVKDAAGKSWLLNYMAYFRNDHAIRYGRITEIPNAALTKNNMNMAVQHFIKLSKQEGGLSNSGSSSSSTASNSDGSAGSTASTKTTTRPSRPETPTTAPGQGLKPDQIKGVVLHQEYGMGVGGMMIIRYNPYLLLKDGTVYSDPYVAAYDLDVTASRQQEPKKWGTWTQPATETLIITMNSDNKPDKWEGKAHWFWARPADKNLKIAGTWSTIGGGGNTAMGGGTMIVSSNVLTFNNQGQFTTQSTGGGTTSSGMGTVTAYSNKDGAGTYSFDGFCLELKYNNGKIVRKNFCSYDETMEVWVWGTSAYTPDDATEKKFRKK